jgi:hypothetical protein
MSFSEDHQEHATLAEPAGLEMRASALVNPASGLANDFLNVYNEILMLVEMLPSMPELADDVMTWRPASYRAYFMQSQLPGRNAALDAYARLDPGFRALFEASVEKLAECAVLAVETIQETIALGEDDSGEQIAAICEEACAHIRWRLESTEQLVNFGRVGQRRDQQAIVNDLFSAA